jgi:hypothetical protein
MLRTIISFDINKWLLSRNAGFEVRSGGGAFHNNHHHHYFWPQVSSRFFKVVVVAFDPPQL